MKSPREIWVIESKLKKNKTGWWPQSDKVFQEKRFAREFLEDYKPKYKQFDFRIVRYTPSRQSIKK